MLRSTLASFLIATILVPPGCAPSGHPDSFDVAKGGGDDDPWDPPPYDPNLPPMPVSCPIDAPPFAPPPIPGKPPATSTVGWTPGRFAVGNLGEATYTIPIVVPPGRRELMPSLAISYASNGPTHAMGPGFRLDGLSSIERCGSTLPLDGELRAVRYDEGDQFCLDGKRLIRVDKPAPDVVQYATYPDDHARVLAYYGDSTPALGPVHWEVALPSGNVARYGATTPAQGAAVGVANTGVHMNWRLSSIVDPFANRVDYAYEQITGNNAGVNPEQGAYVAETYLTEITYAGVGGANRVALHHRDILPISEHVRPAYSNQQPGNTAPRDGMRLTRRKRLDAITTFAGDVAVRTYVIGYGAVRSSAAGDWGGLVSFVQECAGEVPPSDDMIDPADTSAHTCLSPTRFDWDHGGEPDGVKVPLGLNLNLIGGGNPTLGVPTLTVADVNGDGLDDVVAQAADGTDVKLYCAFATGGLVGAPLTGFESCGEIPNQATTFDLVPTDVDTDGRTDFLLTSVAWDDVPKTVHYLKSTIAVGGKLVEIDSGIPRQRAKDLTGYQAMNVDRSLVVGDFDGDGQSDVVTCHQPMQVGGAMTPGVARFWRNDGGVFPGHEDVPLANPCSGSFAKMRALDLDHDGKHELADFSGDYFDGDGQPNHYVGDEVIRSFTRVGPDDWTAGPDSRFIPRHDWRQKLCTIQDDPDSCSSVPNLIGGAPLFGDLDGDGALDEVLSTNERGCALNGDGSSAELLCMADVVTLYGDAPLQPGEALELRPTPYGGGGPPSPVGPTRVYETSTYVVDPSTDELGDGTVQTTQPVVFHYDSDDLADLVVAARPYYEILRSTGRKADPFESFETTLLYSSTFDLQTIDARGTGRSDLVYLDPAWNVWMYMFDQRASRVDRIFDGHDVHDPAGFPRASYEIDYAPMVDLYLTSPQLGQPIVPPQMYLSQCGNFSQPNYPVSCASGTMQVVSTYRTPDAGDFSTMRDVGMFYGDYRYDRWGKRSLGFGYILALDRSTLSGTWTEYDNATPNPDPQFADYPGAGVPSVTRTWYAPTPTQPDAMQIIIETTTDSYATKATSPGTYFRYREGRHQESIEAVADTSGPGWQSLDFILDKMVDLVQPTSPQLLTESRHVVHDVDPYGNVLQESAWSPALMPEWSYAYHGYENVTTGGKWLLGRPTYSDVWSQDASLDMQHRHTEATYGDHGEVETSLVGDPADPETTLSTTYGHDAYGNLTSTVATSGGGDMRSACVTYDASGMFPVLARNHHGHQTRRNFDPRTGAVTATRDPNHAISQRQYDGFGRLVRTQDPFGNVTTIDRVAVRNENPDPACVLSTGHCDLTEVSATTGEWSQEITDMLGRTLATRTRGPDAETCNSAGTCEPNAIVARQYHRDARGHVYAAAGPYLEADPAAGMPITTFEHDGAGRVKQVVAPDGYTTTRWYWGPYTVVDDGATATMTLRDAKGRAVETTDALGSTTHITYGPFDLPIETSVNGYDGSKETTSWEYDDYGRPTTVTEPDQGVTLHTYDGFGDLRTSSDAAQRIVERDYDGLGRIHSRVEKLDASDPGATTLYTYDSTPNGRGRIATIEGADGVKETYTYAPFGAIESLTLDLPTEPAPLVASAEYDDEGRLEILHYPSTSGAPFHVRYAYDGTNTLEAIYGWRIGGGLTLPGETLLWAPKAFDVGGGVQTEHFGNDVTTVRTYHPNTGRLTRIVSEDEHQNPLQDLRYVWAPRGDLTQRKDTLQDVTEHFEYDDLRRLTRTQIATGPAPDWSSVPTAQEVEYAANGNILWKNDVGTYKYQDAAHPHAVTDVTGGANLNGGFGYDAVGNQITRPDGSITYTALNLPRTLEPWAQPVITFTYAADGSRVRKASELAETIWFGRLYERSTSKDADGVTHTFHVLGPDRLVVDVKHVVESSKIDEQLEFIHDDHLGSVETVTDDDGALLRRLSFDPWGKPRSTDWLDVGAPAKAAPVGAAYTGEHHDHELGLIDLHARLYDPALGRMLAVDPVVTAPLDSQRWNAYSYVLNNPLRYTDPTGRDPVPTEEPLSSEAPPEESYSACGAMGCRASNIGDPPSASPAYGGTSQTGGTGRFDGKAKDAGAQVADKAATSEVPFGPPLPDSMAAADPEPAAATTATATSAHHAKGVTGVWAFSGGGLSMPGAGPTMEVVMVKGLTWAEGETEDYEAGLLVGGGHFLHSAAVYWGYEVVNTEVTDANGRVTIRTEVYDVAILEGGAPFVQIGHVWSVPKVKGLDRNFSQIVNDPSAHTSVYLSVGGGDFFFAGVGYDYAPTDFVEGMEYDEYYGTVGF